MKILMAAAENDALPRGKVGGIGDVVRDIPIALGKIDQHVDVVTPSYGAFSKLEGAKYVTSLDVSFGSHQEKVDIFKVTFKKTAKIHQKMLHNGLLKILYLP